MFYLLYIEYGKIYNINSNGQGLVLEHDNIIPSRYYNLNNIPENCR